jgi:MFS family permease
MRLDPFRAVLPLRVASTSEWRNWTVVLACVFGVMLGSTQNYSLGVMIQPIESAFGWTRAEITSGSLIYALCGLFVAPLVGTAVDRYGPRRIALTGVIALPGALALLSTATSDIRSWWLLWLLVGASAMLVGPSVWAAAISGLFDRHRGKALAFTLSGTGLCGSFVPYLVAWLIEAYGWRTAYVGLGLIMFLIVMPTTWFLFTSAADRHRRSADRQVAQSKLSGMAIGDAIRSRSFIQIALGGFLLALVSTGFVSNVVPVLVANGFERSHAAALAGLVGIGMIVGRLVGGFLLDRFNARIVTGIAVFLPAVAGMMIMAAPQSLPIVTAALITLGLAAGAELDGAAYLSSRCFGVRRFATLYGFIGGLIVLGAGISPTAANAVYDAFQSYDAALWALVPLAAVAALLFMTIGRYPDHEANLRAESAEPKGIVHSSGNSDRM